MGLRIIKRDGNTSHYTTYEIIAESLDDEFRIDDLLSELDEEEDDE